MSIKSRLVKLEEKQSNHKLLVVIQDHDDKSVFWDKPMPDSPGATRYTEAELQALGEEYTVIMVCYRRVRTDDEAAHDSE